MEINKTLKKEETKKENKAKKKTTNKKTKKRSKLFIMDKVKTNKVQNTLLPFI